MSEDERLEPVISHTGHDPEMTQERLAVLVNQGTEDMGLHAALKRLMARGVEAADVAATTDLGDQYRREVLDDVNLLMDAMVKYENIRKVVVDQDPERRWLPPGTCEWGYHEGQSCSVCNRILDIAGWEPSD